MPKQGSTVEFKDGQNQFRVLFIMYADFESILEPMGPVEPGSPNQPYTNEVNQIKAVTSCSTHKIDQQVTDG